MLNNAHLWGLGALALAAAASASAGGHAWTPAQEAAPAGAAAALSPVSAFEPCAEAQWVLVRAGGSSSLESAGYGADLLPPDAAVIAGDPAAALAALNGAVVTRELALRLFGTADAVGHEIAVAGKGVAVIGAVISDDVQALDASVIFSVRMRPPLNPLQARAAPAARAS